MRFDPFRDFHAGDPSHAFVNMVGPNSEISFIPVCGCSVSSALTVVIVICLVVSTSSEVVLCVPSHVLTSNDTTPVEALDCVS